MSTEVQPLPARPEGPRAFQALAMKNALKAFVKHGLLVNPQYTLQGMVRTAGNITGRSYTTRRKDLIRAHNDLVELMGQGEML